MRLSADILNCSRTPQEKGRLCLEFRDAMIEYEPNVTILFNWKSRRHPEYTQAYLRGLRAIRPLISQAESERYIIITEFNA